MAQHTFENHRSLFYGDVESLIDPGFISTRWQYGKTQIIFRSLYPSDFVYIHEQMREPFWYRWIVACSIYSVNGKRVVDASYESADFLAEWMEDVPVPVFREWLTLAINLNNRVRNSFSDLNSYIYETSCREKWRYAKNTPFYTDSLSGIQGLSSYGVNNVQRVWSAWNCAEDDRERMIHEWDVAKLVLSGFAGKGVKQLDEQDKKRRQEEIERRQLVQDKWLFDKIGIPYIDHGALFKAPEKKTFEDLAQEAERWFAGEKDFHDRVIDDYMEQLEQRKAAFLEEKQERERVVMEVIEEAIERPMVGYTREQIEEFMPMWNPGVKSVHR